VQQLLEAPFFFAKKASAFVAYTHTQES